MDKHSYKIKTKDSSTSSSDSVYYDTAESIISDIFNKIKNNINITSYTVPKTDCRGYTFEKSNNGQGYNSGICAIPVNDNSSDIKTTTFTPSTKFKNYIKKWYEDNEDAINNLQQNGKIVCEIGEKV
jgi:gas vesicle protein